MELIHPTDDEESGSGFKISRVIFHSEAFPGTPLKESCPPHASGVHSQCTESGRVAVKDKAPLANALDTPAFLARCLCSLASLPEASGPGASA